MVTRRMLKLATSNTFAQLALLGWRLTCSVFRQALSSAAFLTWLAQIQPTGNALSSGLALRPAA